MTDACPPQSTTLMAERLAPCADCGTRPRLSTWNQYCETCWSHYLDRRTTAVDDIGRQWPALATRIQHQVASAAAHAKESAVAWAMRVSDDDFLSLRNMGPKSLAAFRALVPASAAYRRVQEAREQRERADRAEAENAALREAVRAFVEHHDEHGSAVAGWTAEWDRLLAVLRALVGTVDSEGGR